jgi:hypothetical protein
MLSIILEGKGYGKVARVAPDVIYPGGVAITPPAPKELLIGGIYILSF